ncbi:hypothetical protein AKO1_015395 [Acrasis kona]|uniref:Uncharacterized protein n=1 Tax=Acrasis kona TaxID=1008807 RepID=A0AAW2ZFE3_9EUKA
MSGGGFDDHDDQPPPPQPPITTSQKTLPPKKQIKLKPTSNKRKIQQVSEPIATTQDDEDVVEEPVLKMNKLNHSIQQLPSIEIHQRETIKSYIDRMLCLFEKDVDFITMDRLTSYIWDHVINHTRCTKEVNEISIKVLIKSLCDHLIQCMLKRSNDDCWVGIRHLFVLLQIKAPDDIDLIHLLLSHLKMCIGNAAVQQHDDVVALSGAIGALSLVDARTNILPYRKLDRCNAIHKKSHSLVGFSLNVIKCFVLNLLCAVGESDHQHVLTVRILYSFLVVNPDIAEDYALRLVIANVLCQLEKDLQQNDQVICESINGILNVLQFRRSNLEDYIDKCADDLVHYLRAPNGKVTDEHLWVKCFEVLIKYRRNQWEWIFDEMLFRKLWTLFSLEQEECVMLIVIMVAGCVGRLRNAKVLVGEFELTLVDVDPIYERLIVIVSEEAMHNFSFKCQSWAANSVAEIAMFADLYGSRLFDKLEPILIWYKNVLESDRNNKDRLPENLKRFIDLYKQ